MTPARYVSTRGDARELGFADVLLAGLADDGGLYVPEAWPSLPEWPAAITFPDLATLVAAPFVGQDIDVVTLGRLADEAYATFRHPATCPLVQLGPNEWLLELFHGPTLAFKDVALQLVGRLFDHVLAERGARATIVGATSGDTGSAAIDAVRTCDRVDIVILYPHGRVSEVQRRQMTTVDAPHVHAVAVDGTFDDCQDLVKAMFADPDFRDRVQLTAVNSINWARVMAQTTYYAWAAGALGGGPGGRPVAFSVPTGNFGNVLAGWAAAQMGLPIDQLVIGSNRNDILTRFLHSGVLAVSTVVPTLSPAMDIQVSSNFERLLFELNHRDGERTATELRHFRETGSLLVDDARLDVMRGLFAGARLDDDATVGAIGQVYASTGTLLDPHTAIGVAAGRACRRDPDVPLVSLATAHPAKFPEAVERATGVRPALPPHLADLYERHERTSLLPADLEAVEAFVSSVSRV